MDETQYYTYIVANPSRTLYVGVTSKLERRMLEHKDGTHKGFTARYGCDRLVWFEASAWVQVAITREKQLKGWRRSKKIALIEAENPTWVDLSAGWGLPVKMFGEE